MSTPATPNHGPRRWSSLWLGAAVAIAAVVVRGSLAVSPGEPGWLRWLRVLADHPIRAGIAASLLFIALSPPTSDVEEPDGPPSS
jgi:hypothetical protein